MENNHDLEDLAFVCLGLQDSNLLEQLCYLLHNVKVFHCTKECHDYLLNAREEKVFFVVEASLAEDCLRVVHHLPALISTFIYSSQNNDQNIWSQSYSNVRGIFFEAHLLIATLRRDLQRRKTNELSMTTFNPNERSIRENDVESEKFIVQTLLAVLLTDDSFSDRETAKMELVTYCKHYYRNTPTILAKINEFEQNYGPTRALLWWTDDSFLYKVLNKACREENIDLIFKFRFFIKDLHIRLHRVHVLKDRHKMIQPQLVLYRGQQLSQQEFMCLQEGKVITFNQFLATTSDREVAMIYAGDGDESDTMKSVLFEIHVITERLTTPFLELNSKHLSRFVDEAETLFSIGAVFQIEGIKPLDENARVRHVFLRMDRTTSRISTISSIRNYLGEMSAHQRFEQFLCEHSTVELAHISTSINELPPGLSDIIALYVSIGVYFQRAEQNNVRAMFYFEKASTYLSIYSRSYLYMLLVIGNLLRLQRNYETALLKYNQAVGLAQSFDHGIHDFLFQLYLWIGVIHHEQLRNLDQAILYYQIAAEHVIQISAFDKHPLYATFYKKLYHLPDIDRLQTHELKLCMQQSALLSYFNPDIDVRMSRPLKIANKVRGKTTAEKLYIACQGNDTAKVRKLVKGMSIEEINSQHTIDKNTALHVAVYFGSVDIVKILLNSNASPILENGMGLRPSDLAKTLELKALLIRRRRLFQQENFSTAINKDTSKISRIKTKLTWFLCSDEKQNAASEWQLIDSLAPEKATYFREKLRQSKSWQSHLSAVRQYYLQRIDNEDDHSRISRNIDQIRFWLTRAIQEANPRYLITIYTSDQYFSSRLNRDLAAIVQHRLDDCRKLSCPFLYRTEKGLISLMNILLYHPQFHTYTYQGYVYRGVVVQERLVLDFVIGISLVTVTLLSTAKNPSVARMFSDCLGKRGYISYFLTYKIKNQTRIALDITCFSEYDDEEEVLILPYSPFLITDRRENNETNTIEIDFEECAWPGQNPYNDEIPDKNHKIPLFVSFPFRTQEISTSEVNVKAQMK